MGLAGRGRAERSGTEGDFDPHADSSDGSSPDPRDLRPCCHNFALLTFLFLRAFSLLYFLQL